MSTEINYDNDNHNNYEYTSRQTLSNHITIKNVKCLKVTFSVWGKFWEIFEA